MTDSEKLKKPVNITELLSYVKAVSHLFSKLFSMVTVIKTTNDVVKFVKFLIEKENLSLHPDDDFADYVNIVTGEPFYTKEQADTRNILLEKSFEVCIANDVDIYELTFPILQNYLSCLTKKPIK